MTDCKDDIRPECARELAEIRTEMKGNNITMKTLNDKLDMIVDAILGDIQKAGFSERLRKVEWWINKFKWIFSFLLLTAIGFVIDWVKTKYFK